MAVLTAARRNRASKKSFVYGGSKTLYIGDRRHAANALARCNQVKGKSGACAATRARVCKKYPSMPSCQRG